MKTTIDMAREDITRMAREAGFVGFDGENGSLRRFAAIVRADEREETNRRANASWSLMCEKMVAAERAKFTVPDKITDNSESPEYRAGWNDCRELMLSWRKP